MTVGEDQRAVGMGGEVIPALAVVGIGAGETAVQGQLDGHFGRGLGVEINDGLFSGRGLNRITSTHEGCERKDHEGCH